MQLVTTNPLAAVARVQIIHGHVHVSDARHVEADEKVRHSQEPRAPAISLAELWQQPMPIELGGGWSGHIHRSSAPSASERPAVPLAMLHGAS